MMVLFQVINAPSKIPVPEALSTSTGVGEAIAAATTLMVNTAQPMVAQNKRKV